MKARQLVDDIKVKQLQAVKNDVIKKDAAKKYRRQSDAKMHKMT